MNELLQYCPQPPDWKLDWPTLHDRYPWIQALDGCPQDPIYHAEGDVGIHVRLVCEALIAADAWRTLPDADRGTLFLAALFHDVGKPDCTRTDADGRISSRGHSRRGAIMARRILWRLGLPFAQREAVTALVRWHQVPYHLLEGNDAQRRAITVSQTARCDHLAILAEADVRGRVCHDQQRLLDNVSLFAEYCREEGCLTTPRPFPSDHARFVYFQNAGRHSDAPVHDDCRGEVVLMSGLPGAGKDHWIRSHLPDWPVVSLDAIRGELDVEPTDEQGAVIQHARDLARQHLRAGRSFVWNATSLTRQLRELSIRLFADYRARVRIIYREVPAERLLRQNGQRPAPVPRAVIERMLDRWETPDRTEAHQVDWCVDES